MNILDYITIILFSIGVLITGVSFSKTGKDMKSFFSGGGVMISLTKMNKILGYDKENFVVKIQSGVLLNDLAQDAEKQGAHII